MVQFNSLPLLFSESHPNLWKFDPVHQSLTARALPKTDLYCNPMDRFGPPRTLSALTLLALTRNEDFKISAKVRVRFDSTYDAGALLIWSNSDTWAKLCFEFSPDREAMVVSVVTVGVSDDANSFTVPTDEAWLRISRVGSAYAFHASRDGERWSLIRVFTLGANIEGHQAGFVAQAPVGEGCDVTFEEINFSYSSLTELRDGS